MFPTFKEFYNIGRPNKHLLAEVKDTKRNREEVARVYGLSDNMADNLAQRRASELIATFTKFEPMIDINNDYFGDAHSISGKQYNPKDIFSWARVSKDLGEDKLEALQNLEAMIANLKRAKEYKEKHKDEEGDYDIVYDNEHATIYRPRSTGASCKLGRGTKWCTAATKGPNQFNSYVKDQGVTLFYIINKNPTGPVNQDNKWAVVMYPDGETFAVYDEHDQPITWEYWEEIAMDLGLPPGKEIYKKYMPPPIETLKFRIEQATNSLTGRSRQEGDMVEWEHMQSILRAVDRVPEAELKAYRQESGQPDEIFAMNVTDASSLNYFLNKKYNPPGSHEWGNKEFQSEIVRKINRLSHVTKQANTGADERDVQEMDDATNELTQRIIGESEGQFLHYIKTHMGGEWPELGAAIIKNLSTNMEISDDFGRGKEPMKYMGSWAHLIINNKGTRWPEFEKLVMDKIKSMPDAESKTHPGSMDKDFYDTANKVTDMARKYNIWVTRSRGNPKWEDHYAYVPETYEQIQQFNRGEWDDSNLPLTKSAQREVDFKQRNANKSGMDEYIANL
jgi:hypothetical protein